jgi:hypothetical protein
LPELRWSFIAALVTAIGVFLRGRRKEILPLRRQGFFLGYLVFLLWIYIQSFWAINEQHAELIDYMSKYALVLFLIYGCIDNETDLRLFLWAHVLGCGYWGWIAYTSYTGGRFEGFGGPGLDANAVAVQIVTGVLAAASLLLSSSTKQRIALLGVIPFIVNAIVTTISRSGFLALGVGGIIFNLFAPRRYLATVRVFSLLGLLLFISLTGSVYWDRMSSILYAGEEVEGVDTGSGRLDLMVAQWEMFKRYPFGCGHRCTATLSPEYLPAENLTREGARSSHNTFMALLVEQGIPGGIFYILMLFWFWRTLLDVRRRTRYSEDFLTAVFPSVAATLGAIVIGGMFVDYIKLEVRIWFVGVLMVMTRLILIRDLAENSAAPNNESTATADRLPSS